MTTQEMKVAFEQAYGQKAEKVFFAPGRVNLIGEHTDYNGGCVFPCALSFGAWLLLAKNNDKVLRFRSLNMPQVYEIPIDAIKPQPDRAWCNYALGCIDIIVRRHPEAKLTSGYDILYFGNVPAGAGLSSSAAMEVVTARAFTEEMADLTPSLSQGEGAKFPFGYDEKAYRTELALIGQACEHEYAGVMCGVMDQFASAQGKKDHAIYLNCDTLEFEHVPVKLEGIKVVISNTHSPHHLDSGAYNDRVRQCHTAVEQISKVKPIKFLAELTPEDWEQVEGAITDPIAKKRARHVVGEVARTAAAVEALKKGEIAYFGELMTASHVSLRDDYEVTGKELDSLAAAAWQVEGVLGSRMTGGGFGGCTVSLVKDEAIEEFKRFVGAEYEKATGLKADFYVAEIGDGVMRLE
ncbi:MAG: galactokinase [Paludibacteraceae bacterium]|nr:galactokinase [Paludibacteraceae bacterium]